MKPKTNVIAASPCLEKTKHWRAYQIPHQTPKYLFLSFHSTPANSKCKVQSVLEANDLNMFINKNSPGSTKVKENVDVALGSLA